jgi:hypothetical protein
MPRPNGFSQILWLLASPLVAHDMGSKDPANFLCWVERITNQVWWFLPIPKSGSPFQPVPYRNSFSGSKTT